MTASPTALQAAAIDEPGRRLQVLACAGAGKTEVLARRAVRLLAEGSDPATIITFTFTEKAAAELKDRIERRAAESDGRWAALPPTARGMYVGTIHGYCLAALRSLGGIYEMCDALTPEGEWALLLRFARRLGAVDLYASSEGRDATHVATACAIAEFLRSVEVVYDERIDRRGLVAAVPVFAEVLARYESLLEQMRLMPFRSMIGRAADALEPGGSLAERLSGRVDHLLVDEYQDLNRAQEAVVAGLAALGGTLTVVGDDDQAIYQWRGGDVTLFTRFAERYGEVKRCDLDVNHRCRPGIVDTASRLVVELPERAAKELKAHKAPAARGSVEVMHALTPTQEAELVAARIARLVDGGHDPGDVAILFRSVRSSAEPFVAALDRRGIPCEVVGHTSLVAQPETRLVARVLVRWAGGTWYPGPGPKPDVVTTDGLIDDVASICSIDRERAQQALLALDRLGKRVAREGVSDSIPLFNQILDILSLPHADATAQARRLGRMSDLLMEFDHASRRAAPRGDWVHSGADATAEAGEDDAIAGGREGRPVLGKTRGEIYLMRLRAFLEAFAGHAAEAVPEARADSGGAVHIMTVHQAKGLSFPVVFVPSLVERRFPSARTGEPQRFYVPDTLFDRRRYEGRFEDEARLLYVALTRAEELVVLSWFDRHERRRASPSRFVRGPLRAALPSAAPAGTIDPTIVKHDRSEEVPELDFSSLWTYAACGYRYFLRYVCGFRPPRAVALGYGRLMHHVVAELARGVLRGLAPTETELDRILAHDFYFPFAGPGPSEEIRRAARRRAATYLARHAEDLRRVRAPEIDFEVPLAGARIRGRIDLILDVEEGKPDEVEIVDLKTSSDSGMHDAYADQLRLYGLAAQRLGLSPQKLTIHTLEEDGSRTLCIDPEPHGAEEDRFGNWISSIRKERFDPSPSGATCNRCDFGHFCPHTRGDQRSIGPGSRKR